MIAGLLRQWWVWLIALLLPGLTGGCMFSKAYEQMGDLNAKLGEAVAASVEMMRDQGVMDKFLVNAEGEFIEPGVVAEAGMVFRSSARLAGVSGTLDSQVSGTGLKLPSGAREALLSSLENASDEQRAAIWRLLGWQVPAPVPNSAAGPGDGG